jgi:hypothetical protein
MVGKICFVVFVDLQMIGKLASENEKVGLEMVGKRIFMYLMYIWLPSFMKKF